MAKPALHLAVGLCAVAALTLALRTTATANPTIVALAYLVVVLFVAASATLMVALGTSAVAMLAFNYFFLPPVGTLTIADPQNWAVLLAFVAVSAVASQLAASGRARAREAEERRTVAALERQRAELSSALLASLSHDLRTPLTAIQTAVSNIATSADEAHRQDQARVATEQLSRLQRMFDEILDMARIEGRTLRATPDWVSPADIVDAAVAYAGDALNGHALQIDAAADLAVRADPRLTSAALAHVLENAGTYAPAGTPIQVRGWADGAGLWLEVRDGGPGLDPDEIASVFQPFFRGRRTAACGPGTGMGLAITRGLLAAEGGRVWAENVPAGGACFSINVPAPSRALAVAEDA